MDIFRHQEGCVSVIAPCTACKAMIFLSKKLSSVDMNEFIGILKGQGIIATPMPLETELSFFEF
jgi:protein gp37